MKTKVIIKILALALAIAMVVPFLVSCGSTVVMSYTDDSGVVYTITQSELDFSMMYMKAQALMLLGVSTIYDSATYLWDVKYDDETTYDALYTGQVMDSLKVFLIEKYLYKKFGLSIDETQLKSAKISVDEQVKEIGGIGSYKQYWGYTPTQMMNYREALLRSEAIDKYLYDKESGQNPVTDDDLNNYYQSNYKGYMFILLDMNQKVEVDEEGNKVRTSTTATDGTVTYNDAYKFVELTDDEKAEKDLLPKYIHDKLEEGEDFKTLALQYSDNYLTVKYEDGLFIPSTQSIVNDDTVKEAISKLEIGEYTEPISISEGKYTYIIKRVELKDKVYEDDDYAELFTDYSSTVKADKYDKFLEPYINLIVIPNDLSGYKMATTFTTQYVDYYYQLTHQSSY